MEAYQQLEYDLARWSGWDHVVACSSGTAALHLALETMRLPPGSQVIVPNLTMVACARAVSLAGLTPVFADCRDDLLVDPKAVERAITEQTSAVMAVHVYGRPCDMSALSDLAGKHGLKLIEDLAEAHGLPPYPTTDAACWSFYKNKIVCGEEGGAVAFRDPKQAEYARCLRSLGFTPAHDFCHVPRGHNYRMSNLHARPIIQSLLDLRDNVWHRRQAEGCYDRACPPEWRMPPRVAPWVYDFRVRWLTGAQQTRVVRALHAAGVAARHCFKPMNELDEYLRCRAVQADPFGHPRAGRLSREVVYLPLVGDVTDESATAAFRVVREALA